MIDELKEVFELAINCTNFVNELLKIKNTKNKLQQNSSGDSSQLASSGDFSQLASSGYSSKLASSGDFSQLASSGDSSKLASSGYSSKLASSGNSSKLASSGDSSQLASSGDSSQIDSTGKNSVIASIGFKDIVKAKKGSWITLAEYKQNDNNWIVDFVKTERVDGETIKENTYYTLYNHQFVEVQIIDNVKTIILQRKKNIIKGLFLSNLRPCYVVEKDGVYAHGATLKEAKESLIYKITDRDKSDYENYTLDTKVTHEEAIKMYRVITGACEAGTKYFVENVLAEKKEKYTVKEIIKLTEGQYGNEILKEFMEMK